MEKFLLKTHFYIFFKAVNRLHFSSQIFELIQEWVMNLALILLTIVLRHLIVLIDVLVGVYLLLWYMHVHIVHVFERYLLLQNIEHLLCSGILCQICLLHNFAHHFVVYHHVIHLLI